MNRLLHSIRDSLASYGRARPAPASAPAPAPVPVKSFMPSGPGTAEKPLDSALDPHRVKACDSWMSGWFGDDGTLLPGFSIGRGDVVLDRGCGDAAILDYCRDVGATLVAEQDIGGKASHILCLDGLGQADDPSDLLAELVRAGRPGARYLIGVPAALHVALQQELAGTGGRGFERTEARTLIERSGLEVVHESSDGFFWSMLLAFRKQAALAAGESTPALDAWAGCWATALSGSAGGKILRTMNDVLPLRHLLVAVKPGGAEAAPVSAPPARSWPAAWTLTADPAVDTDPIPLYFRAERMSGWYDDVRREIVPGFAITPEDLVLDAGCGTGGIAGICADYGGQMIIADIDADKVAVAEELVKGRSRHDVRTLVTDADPIPLEDGLVSRVVCTEVLEHVIDPDRVLAELIRVSRPGAQLLLTVPGERSEQTQKTLAPESYFAPPNHIRVLDKEQFVALVERSGLQIESYLPDSFYWAMYFVFLWQTGTWIDQRDHSLDLWARTWQLLIDQPGFEPVFRALDALMPKRQAIVARKPAEAGE